MYIRFASHDISSRIELRKLEAQRAVLGRRCASLVENDTLVVVLFVMRKIGSFREKWTVNQVNPKYGWVREDPSTNR